MTPRVTFLVPCYNLAHFLPDCVNSILSQTYGDFEVLILDDCSPDATPDVARSFKDPRVQHIRNEVNLRHLANYNKGIGLARGRYIWLISADDCLRRPYVLQRYVDVLDDHPNVGYAFCPSVRLLNGREDGVMTFTAPASTDRIFPGRAFVRDHLMVSDCVPAPAAMARKECYERVSLFPADLPYAGDWYLWCMFALHYDVAYFSEPMVYRRFHDANMSRYFTNEAISVFMANELAVPWRTKNAAEALGYHDVARQAREAVVRQYVWQIAPKESGQAPTISISLEQFDASLRAHTAKRHEITEIRAGVYANLGDHYDGARQVALARHFYRRALKEKPRLGKVWLKYLLSHLGLAGSGLRAAISTVRRRLHAGGARRGTDAATELPRS